MSLWNGKVPLQVYNNCPDTLWPGIFTASGTGPSTGGFELAAGANRSLEVSSDWNGRVWARTNCTSPGDGLLDCQTGSCAKMDCASLAGNPPATLAEFNLAAGVSADQNFIDISIVDGYNVPLGLEYLADPTAAGAAPPPNLVSPACIATAGYLDPPSRVGTAWYTNATYPMPYERSQTSAHVGHWCPWHLQDPEPPKPGDGIYPYPDDTVPRPVFDPCLSACQRTRSDRDCCAGDRYGTPDRCPRSGYSRAAKAVCPDAYSYPYDDGASTFVLPGGGGWAVTLCPRGRSTDILATFGPLLSAWAAAGGAVGDDVRAAASNVTYIETHGSGGPAAARPAGLGRVLVAAAAAVLVASAVATGGWLW